MIFLDTSSAIDILNNNYSFKTLINQFRVDSFAITTPSIFELYHGIYRLKLLKKKASKQKINKLFNDLETLKQNVEIYPLNEIAAEFASELHVKLISKGLEIDIFDCLIAVIILKNNYNEIITNNQMHFERIEELKVYSF